MITTEFARRFAAEWIAAWNSHDLERILTHYAEDFEMSSPFITRITGAAVGTLRGREAVGAYWKRALERMPELQFELIDVLVGVESVCLYYKSVRGLRAVEWCWFDSHGRVRKAMAHYHELPVA
jgi:ketosteroid isomerase-like protein